MTPGGPATASRATVGTHIVRHLAAAGIERVFCVPGESYLPVLDALYAHARIATITCRHEAGASHMAEAHGKLTGAPGVCLVTRGPGATHASVGVHTARQDSTPMLLLVGDVTVADRGREAFQEVDFKAFFGPIAKAVLVLDVPERVNELMGRALSLAQSGRPGPVVVVLPEDVLACEVEQSAPEAPQVAVAAPPATAIDALAGRLERSERPLLVAGGSGWNAAAVADLTHFAEVNRVPVATVFRRKDLFDNSHPLYAGELGLGVDPRLAERVRGADLLLVLGARLDENTTSSYRLLDPAQVHPALVHIHPDADELNHVFRGILAIAAGMVPASRALAALQTAAPPAREAWLADARDGYAAWRTPPPQLGDVDLCQVMQHMEQALPADAIVTNGAGNYAAWLHRFYRHRGFRTQLAPTSGAMGYGVPAAVAAALEFPARTVVALAGDGCFLMSSQELATVAAQRLRIVVVVINNGGYGTIRMHQEQRYPGRPIATALTNPDFMTYARAFGLAAARITRTDEFPAALAAALSASTASLIELVTDPRQLSPTRTILSE